MNRLHVKSSHYVLLPSLQAKPEAVTRPRPRVSVAPLEQDAGSKTQAGFVGRLAF